METTQEQGLRARTATRNRVAEGLIAPARCRSASASCCGRFANGSRIGALPCEGSILHRGFKVAGLLDVLPDFAIAMDAFLFGARRAIEIHVPTCSSVSRDEAVLVALCGLAQADHDRPLLASLDIMMAPTASRVAAIRLKAFAVALAGAGLRLAPAAGAAAGRLN